MFSFTMKTEFRLLAVGLFSVVHWPMLTSWKLNNRKAITMNLINFIIIVLKYLFQNADGY